MYKLYIKGLPESYLVQRQFRSERSARWYAESKNATEYKIVKVEKNND